MSKLIVLASKSFRRKEILKNVGLDFIIDVSDINEDEINITSPSVFVSTLSKEKAKKVASKYEDAIVIGADTVIVFENEIIGKPKDEDDARKILRKLSGKSHLVLTGFTIIDTLLKKEVTKVVESKVFVKNLSEEELEDYVKTGEALDKAGAYGIQDRAAIFIEKVEGDFYNVVGLPIFALSEELDKLGIKISKFW